MVLVTATLGVDRGSAAFYATSSALAGMWTLAVLATSIVDRQLRIRTSDITSDITSDVTIGVGAALVSFAVFVVAARVGRHNGQVAGSIDRLLDMVDARPVAAVLALAIANAAAEELFFRGALVAVLGGRRGAIASVVVYVAVTAVAGNTALTIAAVVMGTVFAFERQRTDGLTAPIVTHALWSTLMIVALPR